MRALYQGTIGFGLVSIPIQLFKALDEEKVTLHWIHRGCGSRIQYRKYCPHCQAEVEPAELAKAAPLDDGRMVILEEEKSQPKPGGGDRSIGILSFHDLGEVDPIYYRSAYWVKPARGGSKAYRLLSDAMESSALVALAEMTLRSKTELALVRPFEHHTLVLHGLYYPEGLRREGAHFGEIDVAVGEKERDLAVSLVNQMRVPFHPEEFPNRQRHELLDRIERLAAEKAVAPPTPAMPESMRSLIDDLRASLDAVEAVSHG